MCAEIVKRRCGEGIPYQPRHPAAHYERAEDIQQADTDRQCKASQDAARFENRVIEVRNGD